MASRRSSRSNHPNSKTQDQAITDPRQADSDLEDIGESHLVKERQQTAMAPVPAGKSLEELLKAERQRSAIAGNPPETMSTLRLTELGISGLNEREMMILAVGIRCGELTKENSAFLATKKWIEEEIKGQVTAISAVTRQLTDIGEMHKTYALFNSPNPKRKHDAISTATVTSDGIDITKLNTASLEDIWKSWDNDAKIDAIDHYITQILNLDPQPMYEAGNWAGDVAFIPRWHLVAYGKNTSQYKTVYADDVAAFRETLERVINKKPRME
uniref:Phosphoprotein n=1 Tax=maize Iranian mosaic virus TaxID=348823 RepID=A0A0D5CEM1_9RHAB|nr:phosphoprotein [maize Iranian mosaic virus]